MTGFSRRECLKMITGAMATAATAGANPKKVTVAAHAWVYAAPLPGYDYTPVLEQIFSDLTYAGVEALELMERALRHSDSVARIGELSTKHKLPIIATSYEAAMWDRAKHNEIT